MKIYKISQIENEEENPLTFAEYLDYEEYITKDVLKQLIATYKLTGKDFGEVAKLTENGKDFWFKFDEFDNAYTLIDINDWILGLNEGDSLEFLGIEEDNLYVGEMGYLGDIKENPGEVYHYTTEENWEKIQTDGILKPSQGTGLGNRGAYGIFTSIDPEEYAIGTYGNVLLKIDLERFKQEQGIQKLDIDIEPEVKESIIRGTLASRLGLNLDFEHPRDVSINTLIIRHPIPIRYIKVG